METLPSQDVFGNTIFCDDIRAEIGGKFTFVGCYLSGMQVHTPFPKIIPKLCLGIQYWQRKDHIFTPLNFWIFLPGDSEEKPSIEFGTGDDVTVEDLERQRLQAAESGRAAEFITFATQTALNNLMILQPGSIKVRAVRGEQLVRLGSLQIIAAPSASPTK